ncbi:MAG: dephospho-CoA kinase [Alphaproteobacteria bacterium]|nr:dephospho-CoA kinase [Alphaproteobacteria bacterium]
MIVIGVTGSIGMGKSMAGAMLEKLGVPVHDADSQVHQLLRPGSPAWPEFTAAFPHFRYPQIYTGRGFWFFRQRGATGVNRAALGRIVFADQEERARLEGVLHPHVQAAQREFIRRQQRLGRKMVALDIPLLFETGAQNRVDYTLTVSAPAHVQRARVLARPGMTPEKFEAVLARQMPDAEKRARCDFVVHSGLGRAQMMRELQSILQTIRTNAAKANSAGQEMSPMSKRTMDRSTL